MAQWVDLEAEKSRTERMSARDHPTNFSTPAFLGIEALGGLVDLLFRYFSTPFLWLVKLTY